MKFSMKTRAEISFEIYLEMKNTEAFSSCQCSCYLQFLALHLVQSVSAFPVHMCVNVNGMEEKAKLITGIILPSSE